MAAIETRSLSKRYGSLHAVRDLELIVESGEMFGLLGPNGAGKSTTIDILLDFVRPTAGSVEVLGHDPQSEPRAVRERVGTLPEAYGFYDRSTARDHLEFAIRMRDADDDPDALLTRVGIADAADRQVGDFSKGMRQRLGLAVALVGDPELLILDEPLGGLDPAGARLFRDIVRAERDRGAAVLLSSHITTQVEVLCDRVGVMHDGRLVAVDTVAGLRATTGSTDALLVTVDPDSLPVAAPTETDGRVPAQVGAVTADGDRREADHGSNPGAESGCRNGRWSGLGLEELDGVRSVRRDGTTLRIDCAEPGAKAAAVAHLDARGIRIRDLDVDAASLEALFLALTGRDEPDSEGDRTDPDRTSVARPATGSDATGSEPADPAPDR
jgi:ABC-2 type transport system ATP-binding protein